jgi:hypothetical protein
VLSGKVRGRPAPARLSQPRRSVIRIIRQLQGELAKVASLLLLLAHFLCPGRVAAQNDFSIHRLNSFSSTNEILSFFAGRNISIEAYQLPQQVDRYFWVAAYPYSGPDTIDLYCFVHHGSRQWRVQMLYYALHPKTRRLTVLEQGTSMIVKDAEQELVRVAIKPGPKITRCVENLFSIGAAKFEWADENHKQHGDTPQWTDLKTGLERNGVTNGVPTCPQGGTYVVGRVGELPRCAKGGEEHTLPLP